jgi:hypothetical protein
MGDRSTRATVTIVLTLAGVVLFTPCLGDLWRSCSRNPWMQFLVGFGVLLWSASDIALWLHLHATLRERQPGLVRLRPSVFAGESTRKLDV